MGLTMIKPYYTLIEMMTKKKQIAGAAEKYARLVGQQVRIYYQDMKGTHRSLIGTITDTDGDNLWLENGTWKGCLDCANARICIISTTDGWFSAQGYELETKQEY